jgi:ferritin-like metal-binding protein YciE
VVPSLSQIKRSEGVFRMSGHKPRVMDCPIIGGIIEEANEAASQIGNQGRLDAAVLAPAYRGRATR